MESSAQLNWWCMHYCAGSHYGRPQHNCSLTCEYNIIQLDCVERRVSRGQFRVYYIIIWYELAVWDLERDMHAKWPFVVVARIIITSSKEVIFTRRLYVPLTISNFTYCTERIFVNILPEMYLFVSFFKFRKSSWSALLQICALMLLLMLLLLLLLFFYL